MARFVVMLLLLAGTASAGPAPAAVAFNEPFGWPTGSSVAGSLYLGLTARQVLRINVASYEDLAGGLGDGISEFEGGDGAERDGHTTDVGVGWLAFPRAAYDGPMFEAGALYRHRDLSVTDYDAVNVYDAINSDEVAARALVGWSWLFDRHVFVALAVGVSAGYEFGIETTQGCPDQDPTQMTTPVHRWTVGAETYLRFGAVLR
ncbi:MAG TPA: hypothetical protein VMJ10_23780 [Kofleriaceae bacterium]|nr:hypothetical protein [Kofleriaceae bacterium]